MEKQAVSSSTINSIGYDPASGSLEIEFRNGGVYQYSSVPEGIHEALLSANSHGSYLHEHIKEKYQHKKIS